MKRVLTRVRDAIACFVLGAKRLRNVDLLEQKERRLSDDVTSLQKAVDILARRLREANDKIARETVARESGLSALHDLVKENLAREGLERVCAFTNLTDSIKNLNTEDEARWKSVQEYATQIVVRNQWREFYATYSEWWTNGASDYLMDWFAKRERFEPFWMMSNPETWMIYACCLVERHKERKAQDILRRIASRFKDVEYFRYLPIARLVCETFDQTRPCVKEASQAWQLMQDGHRLESLRDFLQGKRVAIVGNSRSHVGLGKGAEIDAHDIVVRCNDYKGKYTAEDYGVKTTIWCRNGAPTQLDCAGLYAKEEGYRFVVWMDDYAHAFVQGEELALISRDFKSSLYTAVAMPAFVAQDLKKTSGLVNPTIGALIIWLLRECIGSLSGVDFYGFSFCGNVPLMSDEHFDQLAAMHDMYDENRFLANVCNGGKDYEDESK